MKYTESVFEDLSKRYSYQPMFLQSVEEVLTSIDPLVVGHKEYEDAALLERLVQPERTVSFRVPWVDDTGTVRVNRGWRVQFSSALGPYKGGLRFHPSVNMDTVKFLGFEQIFKNSLTGLPMGGGKGGSDFNPKGKSDVEVMRFCQSYMTELFRHIGADTDVPAGDIGVGNREIGYLFGHYKRLTNQFTGVLTGKGLSYGGSLIRTEATGYGIVYLAEAILKDHQDSLEGKKVLVSGSGNVAIYTIEKLCQLGACPLTASDSDGWIYDPHGIDFESLKEIKEKRRGRVSEYVDTHPHAEYHEGGCLWDIEADLAIPAAIQNEITLDKAKLLLKNGVKYLIEGANMPTLLNATKLLAEQGVYIAPSKAANAGGVATSGLEMTQNAERLSWSAEEVDAKLNTIMTNIYQNAARAAEEQGNRDNLIAGANMAGFKKVADAMMAQGIV